VAIPVVANGEVWNVDDARRCLAESGCDALMLGRGMVADPGLALALRGQPAPDWPAVLPIVAHYWQRIAGHVAPKHRAGRLKQWLNLLRRRFPQAQQAFDQVRELNDPATLQALLFAALPSTRPACEPAPRAASARADVLQALA
jgi:tRNA-dihydrouridine synthase C